MLVDSLIPLAKRTAQIPKAAPGGTTLGRKLRPIQVGPGLRHHPKNTIRQETPGPNHRPKPNPPAHDIRLDLPPLLLRLEQEHETGGQEAATAKDLREPVAAVEGGVRFPFGGNSGDRYQSTPGVQRGAEELDAASHVPDLVDVMVPQGVPGRPPAPLEVLMTFTFFGLAQVDAAAAGRGQFAAGVDRSWSFPSVDRLPAGVWVYSRHALRFGLFFRVSLSLMHGVEVAEEVGDFAVEHRLLLILVAFEEALHGGAAEGAVVYRLQIRHHGAELVEQCADEEEDADEIVRLHLPLHIPPHRSPGPHSVHDEEHRSPGVRPAGPEGHIPVREGEGHAVEIPAHALETGGVDGTVLGRKIRIRHGCAWDDDGVAALAVVARAPDDADFPVLPIVAAAHAGADADVGWVETFEWTRGAHVEKAEFVFRGAFNLIQDSHRVVVTIALFVLGFGSVDPVGAPKCDSGPVGALVCEAQLAVFLLAGAAAAAVAGALALLLRRDDGEDIRSALSSIVAGVAVCGLDFVTCRYLTLSGSEVSRANTLFHGGIRLSTSSRTDIRIRAGRNVGLGHNLVAIFGNNSIYSSLVSPSKHFGICTRCPSLSGMLVGAGKRVVAPHARQPQPVLVIDAAVRLGIFALPRVLDLIVVEWIRGLEDPVSVSGSHGGVDVNKKSGPRRVEGCNLRQDRRAEMSHATASR